MELICCIIVIFVMLLTVGIIAYSDGGELKVIAYHKDRNPEFLKLKYEKHKHLILVTGSGTVWNHFPKGNRCSTFMEAQIVEAIKEYEFSKMIENE